MVIEKSFKEVCHKIPKYCGGQIFIIEFAYVYQVIKRLVSDRNFFLNNLFIFKLLIIVLISMPDM